MIEITVVAPQYQGLLGDRLMQFAEEAPPVRSRRLFLYTNVDMTEKLEYYPKLGYKEYKHTRFRDFKRVFFKKWLGL